jgi:hypothetical protein
MDEPTEDFAELEAELKALRPAAPSARLHARVATELDPHRRANVGWMWGALPAAAALALGIFLSRSDLPANAAAPATAAFRPVAAENILYATNDEGYVTLEDGTPARRVRAHYVDTITWKNPGGRASLRWTVPREEIRVVPVSFQ